MKLENQLPIPDAVLNDDHSMEILKVWVVQNRQQFSFRTDLWDDPAGWGLLLADLANSLANAISNEMGADKKDILDRIKAGFELEISSQVM